MIDTNEHVVKLIGRLICGEEKPISKATAFLISPTKVITARHSIEEHYSDENVKIELEFMNLTNEPIKRYAKPLESLKLEKSAISILELDEPIECERYLCFYDYEPKKDDKYETFGYPVAKWAMGEWTKAHVSRRVTEEMARPFDWDIDLSHTSNIGDFSGLSGSPLFINSMLIGVILTESQANNVAVSLGAISINGIREILKKAEIPIVTQPAQIEEVYELEGEVDYSKSLFLLKLESAQIFEHEDFQLEFYNAEIMKSSIESRNLVPEIKSFTKLKHEIKGVWKTKHIVYKDEMDGNELLSTVYERIENMSETTLKGDGSLSLTIKKGMLHQLSDECKVGWVKNYKKRLHEYLLEEEKK